MKKNENQIRLILNELSELIPEIRDDEEKWGEFIQAFIEARPDASIDANFRAELKEEILRRAQFTKNKGGLSYLLRFWRPAGLFLGGVAVSALVIFPMLNMDNLEVTEKLDEIVDEVIISNFAQTKKAPTTNTNSIEDNAFGKLVLDKSENNSQPEAIGIGGGGGAMMERMAIMPQYFGRTNFDYEYVGDEIPIGSENVFVYKKQKMTVALDPAVASFLGKFFAVDTFQNLELGHINFVENKKLGYMISIDSNQNSVNYSQNWEKWPQGEICEQDRCFTPRIKKEDLLSDDKLIVIAKEFLSEHKVPLENFGAPFVQKDEQPVHYEPLEEVYYPDTYTVVFPTLVDGKEVEASHGQKMGVRVSVSLRHKKVSFAEMPLSSFDRSAYPAATAEQVLGFAKSGGTSGARFNNPDKTISLKLGTPEKTITQIYVPIEGEKYKRAELFVESLVFPVLEMDMDDNDEMRFSIPKQIVVPLAADLLN